MNSRLEDLYRLSDIEQYEDVNLLTLRECCAVLEDKVVSILDSMSCEEQQTIEAYIDLLNELEFQSVKAALRWGKRNRQ